MALEDDVRNLARNPTLAELEPDALRLIAFSAETRILRAGDVLFRLGDAADGAFFVLTGTIVLGEPGDVQTRIVGPSTLIGDMAIITETRRPTTAMARSTCSILKISRTLFHRVLSEYPSSAERLRRAIAGRVRQIGDEIEAARTGAFVVR